jgi:hypothetical protein
VACQGEQIGAERRDIHGYFPCGLRGIDVNQRSGPPRGGGGCGDRLHRAGLVVGVHETDGERRLAQPAIQHVELDHAMAVHRDHHRPKAEPAQCLGRCHRRGVLHGAVRDLAPARGTVRIESGAFQRVVRRLGAAAREDDFVGVGANQVRHFSARLRDRIMGGPAIGMLARRIAEFDRKPWQHGIEHGRVDRRRRVVVQVDGFHGISHA